MQQMSRLESLLQSGMLRGKLDMLVLWTLVPRPAPCHRHLNGHTIAHATGRILKPATE